MQAPSSCRTRQTVRLQAAVFAASGIVGLSALASAQPAAAATVVQSFTVNDIYTNFTPSDSSQTYRAPAPVFTVEPFSSSLGSLLNTTITWATAYTMSGVVGSAATSGGADVGYGGALFVNGSSYDGFGNGSGSGGATGTGLAFMAGPTEASTTFRSAEAGSLYDPAILAAFLGESMYTVSYINSSAPSSSPYTLGYTNIASGTAIATSSVTVAYEYTPAPNTPVPGPLPLIGAGAAWTWSRTLRRRLC